MRRAGFAAFGNSTLSATELHRLAGETPIAVAGAQWLASAVTILCFTPTYTSWANPIEAHFGPLREFVLKNSHHPNHVVLTRRLHAYLRWRNANARDPELLEAQRRERRRVRSEKQRR